MCACVSGDAPSKSGPRRGVIHDFITQALHKAPSNTSPFLSAPRRFFPMLPQSLSLSLSFLKSFPPAFLTPGFLCPLSAVLPFSGRQPSPSLSSLPCLWIYTILALISLWSSLSLSLFPPFFLSLLFTPLWFLPFPLPSIFFIFSVFSHFLFRCRGTNLTFGKETF